MILRLAPAVVAFVILAGALAVFQGNNEPGDAGVYLAAARRLNAGLPLYEFAAWDGELSRVWTYPILSPPFIAVLWRPLAVLGEWTVWLWWAGGLVSVTGTLVALTRRQPLLAPLGAMLLAPGLVHLVGFGNVSAYLFGGAYLVWRYRDHPGAGAVVAVMAAVKLAPVVLLAYLVGRRNWRGVGVFAATGAVCAAVSLLGAGWQAHLDYLPVMASVEPTHTSLEAVTGIPGASWVALGLGAVAGLVGWWPGVVVGWTFGTPALYLAGLSYLLLLGSAKNAPAWEPGRLASLLSGLRPVGLLRRAE